MTTHLHERPISTLSLVAILSLASPIGPSSGCSKQSDLATLPTGPAASEPDATQARDEETPPPREPAASVSGPPEVISLHTGRAFRFKGLAIDTESERAYLGSWDAKALVVVDLRDGTHRVIPTRFGGKLNAMGVDLREGKLYAVMNEIDDRPRAKALSVLVVVDTATETVSRHYELRGTKGRHHLNHVVVDRRGVAYVSDTLHATIHRVDTEDPGGRLEPLVTHESLAWIHGIDLSRDESKLFSTSYEGGIKIFDLEEQALTAFEDLATAGDDGLKYYEGHLYGVGGNTITRYRLDAAEEAVVGSEVLLRDHERFNDPRDLHVENGVIYCLANIELEPVTFAGDTARRGRAQDDSHLVVLRL